MRIPIISSNSSVFEVTKSYYGIQTYLDEEKSRTLTKIIGTFQLEFSLRIKKVFEEVRRVSFNSRKKS